MEALLKRRAISKSKLTRVQTYLENLKASNQSVSKSEIQIRMEMLDSIFNQYENIQEEIDSEETAIPEAELTERTSFENKYVAIKSELRMLVHSSTDKPKTENKNNTEEITGGTSVKVNLPKLEIPTFDGNIYDWPSFADLFKAAVGDVISISGAQKLQYLKGCLRGEAAALVSSYQITNDNYTNAWKVLEKKYDDQDKLRAALIHRLLKYPTMQFESQPELSKFVDTITATIDQLANAKLHVYDTSADVVLLCSLEEKLDMQIRREWDIYATRTSKRGLNSFIEHLSIKVKALPVVTTSVNKYKQGQLTRSTASQRSNPMVHHASASNNCRICDNDESHPAYKCSTFLKMSSSERIGLAKQHRLCFNCLSSEHIANQEDDKSSAIVSTSANSDSSGSGSAPLAIHTADSKGNERPNTLLSTAILLIKNAQRQLTPCRALLDSGAQTNLMTEDCADRLGLVTSHATITISGVGASDLGMPKGIVTCQAFSKIENVFQKKITAYILPTVAGILPQFPCQPAVWAHVKGLKLADPAFNIPDRVDVLLGAEFVAEILIEGLRRGPEGTPIAQASRLGWLLFGRVPLLMTTVIVGVTMVESKLEKQLKQFWEVEELPASERLCSAEQEACQSHFESTHTRDEVGRYVVQLPFRSTSKALGESKYGALRRWEQMERKLIRLPNLRKQYDEFLMEYHNLDHMERILPEEDFQVNGNHYYLPHHAVLRETSSTTKLRVVFDASSKTTTGISLNELLLVGPQLQDDLVTLLIRFRTHVVALSADIAKMYRQIRMNKCDTEFQRILWRKDGFDCVEEYRLLTLTYGTASAPYLATKCLEQLANEEENSFQRAAAVLKSDFYMDDLLSGADTINEALLLQTQLITLLKKGGFELRKWSSNCMALLEHLSPEMRECDIPLSLDKSNSLKTLGVHWIPGTDQFHFSVNPCTVAKTKREVLSEIAKLFDPMGWLSPITIKAKILMQLIWKEKLEWDDVLSPPLLEEWTKYQNQLAVVKSIHINRCFIMPHMKYYELHGFSDASEKAYAAVVFFRSVDKCGNLKVSLVAAKTKVAPLKVISLPRLELCAANMLAKLMTTVKNAMRIPPERVVAWSDSTVTLAWIAGDSDRWKTFVGNRVTEIQGLLPPEHWRHVSGTENPADCASRGMFPLELCQYSIWWNGPKWLHQAMDLPKLKVITNEEEQTLVEAKGLPAVYFTKYQDIVNAVQCSSLSRLLRVTAYCKRFATNCKQPADLRQGGFLRANELERALTYCIIGAQNSEFGVEIRCLNSKKTLPTNSKLLSLHPWIDSEGVLRVGGRLRHANITSNQRHPMILPKNHKLTQMIVESEHLKYLHAGPTLLLSLLQHKFWMLGAKDVIRHFVRK